MAAEESGSRGSVARVRDALARLGLDAEIKEFDATTRTSADAAAAIGCEIAQIAKSVVFRAKSSNQPVLVIASGVNRVDEKKLEAALGDRVGRADADFVRAATGFAIGGVAPVGHSGPVQVFIDADLRQFAEIWAAAGSPNAVFRLTPAELEQVTGGRVIAVK
jgi:prolyl-tRNA editing enzyme YbaK/EbsC (Cys-tRNA(Pro) deacylase)